VSRPRIFISSTYYDLQHIRSSMEDFINRMGYEAILSEKGRIAYDPDMPLDESCYREATASDIFVLIVGGKYGSSASDEKNDKTPEFYDRYNSVTKKEYNAASSRDIPIYILVEKQVYSEYETYKKNMGNETVEYAHVDSINIFHLLEEILTKSKNNPVYQFERHIEIEDWLKEQWAGLFHELINRRSQQKQFSSLSDRVAELSSINSSLQRYMEEVISNVSDSSEDAERIIKSEKERLESDKKRRDFQKIKIINETIELYDVDAEIVEDIYRNSTTLNNLAESLEEATSGEIEAEHAIKHWHDNPDIVNRINIARTHLDSPPLEFEEN